ncbi:hypothetical protein DUGA6_14130 [Duganella sp. HH105]|nr:hypothetical protein [Duganella sp. HH105]OEZ62626.1 hypothetical protein DUGA6_14130 [Duganella sp. HH105]
MPTVISLASFSKYGHQGQATKSDACGSCPAREGRDQQKNRRKYEDYVCSPVLFFLDLDADYSADYANGCDPYQEVNHVLIYRLFAKVKHQARQYAEQRADRREVKLAFAGPIGLRLNYLNTAAMRTGGSRIRYRLSAISTKGHSTLRISKRKHLNEANELKSLEHSQCLSFNRSKSLYFRQVRSIQQCN